MQNIFQYNVFNAKYFPVFFLSLAIKTTVPQFFISCFYFNLNFVIYH